MYGKFKNMILEYENVPHFSVIYEDFIRPNKYTIFNGGLTSKNVLLNSSINIVSMENHKFNMSIGKLNFNLELVNSPKFLSINVVKLVNTLSYIILNY